MSRNPKGKKGSHTWRGNPQNMKNNIRLRKAIRMRLKGHTWDDIAEALNYKSHESCRASVSRWMKVNAQKTHEDARALLYYEMDSLTLDMEALYDDYDECEDGKERLQILDRIMKLKEHRARLGGLYAPEKLLHQMEMPALYLSPPDGVVLPQPHASIEVQGHVEVGEANRDSKDQHGEAVPSSLEDTSSSQEGEEVNSDQARSVSDPTPKPIFTPKGSYNPHKPHDIDLIPDGDF